MKKYIIISLEDYNKLEEIKNKYEMLIKRGDQFNIIPDDISGKKTISTKIKNVVEEIVVKLC